MSADFSLEIFYQGCVCEFIVRSKIKSPALVAYHSSERKTRDWYLDKELPIISRFIFVYDLCRYKDLRRVMTTELLVLCFIKCFNAHTCIYIHTYFNHLKTFEG